MLILTVIVNIKFHFHFYNDAFTHQLWSRAKGISDKAVKYSLSILPLCAYNVDIHSFNHHSLYFVKQRKWKDFKDGSLATVFNATILLAICMPVLRSNLFCTTSPKSGLPYGGTAPLTRNLHVLCSISKLSTPFWKKVHASESKLSKEHKNGIDILVHQMGF